MPILSFRGISRMSYLTFVVVALRILKRAIWAASASISNFDIGDTWQ